MDLLGTGGVGDAHRHVRHDSRHAAPPSVWRGGAQLGAAAAGYAGGTLGWRAVLSTRVGLHREQRAEHVHADRHWDRRRLWIQCAGDAAPNAPACILSSTRRNCCCLFRSSGHDYRAGVARAGVGTAGEESDEFRDQKSLAPGSGDSSIGPSRWERGRCSTGSGACRGPVARAAG